MDVKSRGRVFRALGTHQRLNWPPPVGVGPPPQTAAQRSRWGFSYKLPLLDPVSHRSTLVRDAITALVARAPGSVVLTGCKGSRGGSSGRLAASSKSKV